MPKSNWSSSTIVQTCEERGRRQCPRGLRLFFLVVGHWELSGVVKGRDQSFRERLCPHEWISIPQAQQIVPVKSLLPQSTPTHLSISSHPRCLIRDAIRVQSDRSSWILIVISSTRFHRLQVPLPWSYKHLVSPLA